jgi:predicted metal-dependent peptidase
LTLIKKQLTHFNLSSIIEVSNKGDGRMTIKMSQEDRITKSRIQLLMEFPFFGYLSNFLKLVETKSIPTAATDGKRYLYNPDFIDKLNEQEVNFLTAHETLHPALGHLWRWENKDKLIFNHAADYVINAMILECDPQQQTFKIMKGGLYDKKFDGMSTEEVYDILINDKNYVQQAYADQSNGKSGTIDSHEMWGEGSGDDGDKDSNGKQSGESQGNDNNEEDWQGRVVQAAQAAEGSRKGTLPSLIKRLLKDLTQPQKNWKQLLAEFLQQEISDYGFNPPDRRFAHSDIILPDFSEPEDIVKNLVFAVDTSGSIGEKEFSVFLSEILGCMSQFGGKVKGKLIYCDAAIRHDGVYDLEDVTKSIPRGGGGTDFRPVFDWIGENLDDCAGLVYLTDGAGEYPKQEPKYPVLWVLTSPYDVPFGLTTSITV